jgi:hypothetical protein
MYLERTRNLMQNKNVVQIYPGNPHYLMFKGEPILLITSAEHYGAVINPDFDFRPYLARLAEYGLNYTRIYPGAYVEVEGMFIENNMLAPKKGRHLLPWARSNVAGCWDGGNQYDLDAWSEDFFHRLRDFIAEAVRHDIVVEICFFNCQYEEGWHACPLNAANNIQQVGAEDYNDFQTLKNPELTTAQDRYVEKILREVNDFDNVILEICDEPTLKGTPAPQAVDWIDHLVGVIVAAENGLPKQHVIAQQYMNGVDFTRDKRVPLITTQYIRQSSEQIGGVEALDTVYHLQKPIELNETAFYPIWYEGDIEAASRAEAWEFMVGGGAAFNQLNGRFCVPDPAGNTPDNLRILTSLNHLKNFMVGFAFQEMVGGTSFLLSGLSEGSLAQGMSEEGRQYALYIHHSTLNENGVYYIADPGTYQENLVLLLPAGRYRADWVLPEENRTLQSVEFEHAGGEKSVSSPVYTFDIALRIVSWRPK